MNKLDRFLKEINESLPQENDFSNYLFINYLINVVFLLAISILAFLSGILTLTLSPSYALLSLINMIIKYDYEMKSKDTLKNILPNWAKELHINSPYYKLDTTRILVKNKALDSFILDFMIDYNTRFDTYDHNSWYICGTDRRRSLGDIYLICKGYYPGCTIEDVFKILIRMLEDGTINGSYCNTINKFVFYNSSSHNNFDVKVEYKEGIKFKQLLELYKNK